MTPSKKAKLERTVRKHIADLEASRRAHGRVRDMRDQLRYQTRALLAKMSDDALRAANGGDCRASLRSLGSDLDKLARSVGFWDETIDENANKVTYPSIAKSVALYEKLLANLHEDPTPQGGTFVVPNNVEVYEQILKHLIEVCVPDSGSKGMLLDVVKPAAEQIVAMRLAKETSR
jgi:alkanesulfonate monooxygenase SsuD/methylene tetrahydromethanopterin reductase-like flavin-dependent oxidoreductase (luciferase family)